MKLLFGLILSVFLCVSATEAQKPIVSPTPPAVEEDCGLTDAELLTLDVSVWSSKAGYLKDLTYKDFEVYIENVPQKVEFFVNKSEPSSVSVLFDKSNSMNSERSNVNEVWVAAEGFESFLDESHPENDYTLLTFGEKIDIVQETTNELESVRKALDKIKKIHPKDSKTILYDAIRAGFEKVLKGKHRRKILFLFTDAINNGSQEKFEEIKKISKKENVTVHFIKVITQDNALEPEQFFAFRAIPVLKRQFGDLDLVYNSATSYYANNSNLIAMNEMVFETGGRFFCPTNIKETAETFRDVAEETKSQYVLGVLPENSGKGAWNRIKVKLNLPKDKLDKLGKISVRTKGGYYSAKS
jgi:VWFA-related protein